jgi:hypothetical protein
VADAAQQAGREVEGRRAAEAGAAAQAADEPAVPATGNVGPGRREAIQDPNVGDRVPQEAGAPAGEGAPASDTAEAAPEAEAPPGVDSEAPSADPGRQSPERGRAPAASSVDAEMLRRSWPQVVEALKARRKMIVYANAQVATVGEFDGSTLELVFPPGREFGARKVEEKQAELAEVLTELFGIAPKFRYSVRQGMVVEAETDEPPPTPEDAERRLREHLGAEVVEED